MHHVDDPKKRLLRFTDLSETRLDIDSIESGEKEIIVKLNDRIENKRAEKATANVSESLDLELELEKHDRRKSLYKVEKVGPGTHKQKVGPAFGPDGSIPLGTLNPVLRSGEPADQNTMILLKFLVEYIK